MISNRGSVRAYGPDQRLWDCLAARTRVRIDG
jgi:hypothetical protein